MSAFDLERDTNDAKELIDKWEEFSTERLTSDELDLIRNTTNELHHYIEIMEEYNETLENNVKK